MVSDALSRCGRQLSLSLGRAARKKPITRGASTLPRCLKLRDIVGFGIGVTVGGGIFVATGEAAAEAGPGVVLSYMLAAAGCTCTGLCYAELALLAPSAGSSYSFAYNAIGELPAYVIGIFNVMGCILSAAAVARGCASYFYLLLLGLGMHPPASLSAIESAGFEISPLACILVVVIGGINLRGAQTTATLNGIITASSVFLLLSYVVVGASAIDVARWSPYLPKGVGGVVRAAGIVFFAFLGFDGLATLSEEAEDSGTVPRGIVITLAICTALYVMTAAVFTGLVSLDEISAGDQSAHGAPLASAARLRGLGSAVIFISIGAVGNTMTTVVGNIVSAPRIFYAMAADGLMPESLALVNNRGVPERALLVTVMPTAFCAGLFSFGALADIVSAGALCSFCAVCASLIILRCPSNAVEVQSAARTSGQPLPATIGCSSNDGTSQHETSTVEMSCDASVQSHEDVHGKETEICEDSAGCKLQNGDELPHAPRSLLWGLALYWSSCMAVGCALRPASVNCEPDSADGGCQRGLYQSVPLYLSCPLLVISMFLISWPFASLSRRHQGRELQGLDLPSARVDGDVSSTFRLPCMPLIPLIGMAMSVGLLSQMPFETLTRGLGVASLCIVVYFCYSAPKSRLEAQGEKLSLVDAPVM